MSPIYYDNDPNHRKHPFIDKAQVHPVAYIIEFIVNHPKVSGLVFANVLIFALSHGYVAQQESARNILSGKIEVIKDEFNAAPIVNVDIEALERLRYATDEGMITQNLYQDLITMKSELVAMDGQLSEMVHQLEFIDSMTLFLQENHIDVKLKGKVGTAEQFNASRLVIQERIQFLEQLLVDFEAGTITVQQWEEELGNLIEVHSSFNTGEAQIIRIMSQQLKAVKTASRALLSSVQAGVDFRYNLAFFLIGLQSLVITLAVLSHYQLERRRDRGVMSGGGKFADADLLKKSRRRIKGQTGAGQTGSTANTPRSTSRPRGATSQKKDRAVFKDKPANMSDEAWLEALEAAANSDSSTQ